MRKIAILTLAGMAIAATSYGQNDPLSLSVQRSYQGGALNTYSAGGFKVLVRNNTSGKLEVTNYAVSDDTVNASFVIAGNGVTGHAFDFTTPVTFKHVGYGMMNTRGGGRLRVQDSANTSKFVEVDAHAGISAKDTLLLRQKHFAVNGYSGAAIVAADSTQMTVGSNKLRIGSDTGPFIATGTGSPNGTVQAPVGSLYIRTNGVPDSTLYIKSSGTGNTGWYPAAH